MYIALQNTHFCNIKFAKPCFFSPKVCKNLCLIAEEIKNAAFGTAFYPII